MPRIATGALGVLTAALLTAAAPGSAFAATGQLVLNGRIFADPAGCYRNLNAPLSVQNRTHSVAYVFSAPDCTGPSQSVPAGQSVSAARGHSVRI